MSTNTLASNIRQATGDFADIKEAIIEKGVPVPAGTRTSEYEELIRQIRTGSTMDDYLAAALRTVYVTGHGGSIDKQCEAFTREIVVENRSSPVWSSNNNITAIDASFEKMVFGFLMFNGASALRSVKTNLNSLVDGTSMFESTPIETFEVPDNTLPELTNGMGMFQDCKNLVSFNTIMPKVQRCSTMFEGCSNLETFNMDISGVTNAGGAFRNCSKLKVFNSKLTNLQEASRMFHFCRQLESFNCDMPNLRDAVNMFTDCSSLKNFTGNMPNLTIAFEGFKNCTTLQTFTGDMPKLQMNLNLFQYCTGLETFTGDLSGLKDGGNMFNGCGSLVNFNSSLTALENGQSMFGGCNKLSVESLQNIITSLPARSHFMDKGSLTIGSINIAKLSQEYIDLATAKNWELS